MFISFDVPKNSLCKTNNKFKRFPIIPKIFYLNIEKFKNKFFLQLLQTKPSLSLYSFQLLFEINPVNYFDYLYFFNSFIFSGEIQTLIKILQKPYIFRVFILWQWRWYNLTLILSPMMDDLVSTLLKHTVKKNNIIKS